ncbi:unnamed protein product [Staurois parvus]|uniref:Uncharacterized protein n=1 Tax=Staurois parvus TaxID=386267 RepID=A0ABN9BLP6_9NEOB|nr:unnamed protein product [Staurois parvus]
MGPLCPCPNSKKPMKKCILGYLIPAIPLNNRKLKLNKSLSKAAGAVSERCHQGRTDNSWGPPGNRGSWGPCALAQTQKSL